MWRLKRRISHDGLASIISVSQRLNHLISAALTQVGEEDEDGKLTKQVIEKLKELYIKTPDQLRQALDTPEVLEQVMNTALRGMLLPAVRDELKHDEHAALWGKARPKLFANFNSRDLPMWWNYTCNCCPSFACLWFLAAFPFAHITS